ncbi:phosphoglycerate mutase [Gramella sp. BOM4]|nr:phosphoglycerate mutase [Christiangramia bathymodioli]
MRKILIILPVLFILLNSCSDMKNTETNSSSLTTYYLIRHAEKDRSDSTNRDPQLTEAGQMRAENWAKILKDVEFDIVYSTDYNRTRQTAKPLAEKNGLETIIYDPETYYNEEFQQKTSGKKVLIVGHSNTTPQFVNAILGEKKYQDLDDSENGGLFIVQVAPDGTKTSQVLYFNNY